MSEIKLTKETLDQIKDGIKNALETSITAEKEHLELEISDEHIRLLEGLNTTSKKLSNVNPSIQFYLETHYQIQLLLTYYVLLKIWNLISKRDFEKGTSLLDNNSFEECRDNIKDCLEFFQNLSEKL